MKIEIDALQIYERLRADNLGPQDRYFLEATEQLRAGEEWKGKKSSHNIPEKPPIYFGDEVSMPPPFRNARIYFVRCGSAFEGNVTLRAILREELDGFDFEGLSERLRTVYGDNWFSIDNFGRGYVLENGTPRIAINGKRSKMTGDDYKIIVGKSGADKRSFGSPDHFISDTLELEKATNVFLEQSFKLAEEVAKTNRPPKNLVLRLS